MSNLFVGYWEIGGVDGVYISLEQRPFWVHRIFMWLLLGIVWHDGPTPVVVWEATPHA